MTFCPASLVWKEAGFDQWGHVYCDEFHQAAASSYHPDGNVVIPINMMKGDDRCHFRWVMPGGAQAPDESEPTALGRRLAEDYKSDTDEEAARKSLTRSNRLVGGRYVTAARAILADFGDDGLGVVRDGMRAWGRDYKSDTDEEAARKSLTRSNRLVGGRYVTAARAILADFGDDGLGVVRDGMRAWGRMRGEFLRREHEKRGLEIGPVSLMRQHDFPCATVWDVEESEATPERYAAQIRWTPQDEVWRDLDAVDLGEHWYGAAYGALVEAYLPGAHIAWPRLQCRGDAVSEIEITA